MERSERAVGRSGAACQRIISAILVAFAAGCTTDGAADASGDDATRSAPPAAVASIETIDDAGRVVRLAAPARRIISLLPAATETLMELGAGDRLVGRTDYDDPAVDHLPSVGGGLTPSIELIASLDPDLVIAWEEAGGARIRPRLESLGIAVFAIATRDTAGIFANIERFGALTGLEERAAGLAGELRADLDEIRASVVGRDAPAVLYMIGLDPPMVAGPNVFIGEILEVAGGRNVFSDITAPSPQVSLEEIVRRRPRIVLIPASGAASMPVERLAETPGWRQLVASGETRFHTLPPDLLHRPGPSIATAARRLRDLIHPDPTADR